VSVFLDLYTNLGARLLALVITGEKRLALAAVAEVKGNLPLIAVGIGCDLREAEVCRALSARLRVTRLLASFSRDWHIDATGSIGYGRGSNLTKNEVCSRLPVRLRYDGVEGLASGLGHVDSTE